MTPDEFEQFNLRERCIAACVTEFHRQARDVDVPLRYAKSLEGTAAMFYDTVASLIREDEREQVKAEYVPVLMEHLRILADLSTKVKALRPADVPTGDAALIEAQADGWDEAIDAVLDLINGGNE